MTKSSKRLAGYLATILPITIATVTMRTVALLLYLDDGLIYFTTDTLITAATALTVAFCLFCVSYSFIPGQNMSPASSFVNPRTYIPSGLAAISLLFVGGELTALLIPMLEAVNDNSPVSPVLVVLLLTVILAFVSTVNFFLNAFYEKRQSRSRAAFSMCTVLFLALYAGYLFFSTELPINSPNKATDQMAFLAMSLFFLYETRISLGRPLWKPYITFGMISSSLALYSAVPSLIFFFANGMKAEAVISQSIAENVLMLTLGIYSISRITLVLTLVPDKACNTALAVEKMVQIRSEEIAAAKEERKAGENAEIIPEAHTGIPTPGANYEMDFGSLEPLPENSEKEDKE